MGFSIGSALRFGWETFKRRPWLFVGAFLLIVIAQGVVEGAGRGSDRLFTGSGEDFAILGSLVYLALSALVSMGVTAFALAAHDNPDTVSPRCGIPTRSGNISA